MIERFVNKKLRFGRKAKGLVACLIIGVLIVSFLVFLPQQRDSLGHWLNSLASGPKSPGLIESAETVNSTVWRAVATSAWAYFQLGVGVDSKTGLPYAGASEFKGFTDWDLGVYIQAVIDAQKIGLISVNGAWGANERLDNVVRFLETRPLNETTNYPFWFYDGTNGKDYHALSDKATTPVDGADTGRLLVALSNLRNYDDGLFASRINYVVYNRTDYTDLVDGIANASISDNIYAYYIYSGYGSFWPSQVGEVPTEILDNILSKETITANGVILPKVPLTCEPLLCSIFEISNVDSRLSNLMKQVYLAHEAHYNATGQFVAFSEGNSLTKQFIYEWIVAPNGGTWKITNDAQTLYYNIDPIIYSKVAFSFLSLYNTTYSYNLAVHVEKILPTPTEGYLSGIDTTGKIIPSVGSNTNGLILGAALYAIQNER
jgi:hypothetical protein